MLNSVQVWSLVRQILLSLGGGLVAKGYIDGGTLEAIVGALVTLATAGYGLWVRRKTALIAQVDKLPEVKKIVTTPAMADKVDSSTVVPG